jgi:hypothetical protein
MKKERLADDLLLGARPIADWIGCSPRQVYYWARIKKFGLFHVGAAIAARKSRILKEVAQLEAAARRGRRQRNRAAQERGAAASEAA